MSATINEIISNISYFKTNDNANIAYTVVGDINNNNNNIVLCFNPAGHNIYGWSHCASILNNAGITCILHDCRGSGYSDAATNKSSSKEEYNKQFHFDTYCNDAANLLKYLNVTEKVIVWGSSWGARVATVFASTHGKYAKALCAYDISIGAAAPPIQQAGNKMAYLAAQSNNINLPQGHEKMTFHKNKPQRTLGATRKKPYDKANTFADCVLPNLNCPVLIAIGEFDPNMVTKPGGGKQFYEMLVQESQVESIEYTIIKECGHGSVLTRPILAAAEFVSYCMRNNLIRYDKNSTFMLQQDLLSKLTTGKYVYMAEKY